MFAVSAVLILSFFFFFFSLLERPLFCAEWV